MIDKPNGVITNYQASSMAIKATKNIIAIAKKYDIDVSIAKLKNLSTLSLREIEERFVISPSPFVSKKPIYEIFREAHAKRVSKAAVKELARILDCVGVEIVKEAMDQAMEQGRKTIKPDDIKKASTEVMSESTGFVPPVLSLPLRYELTEEAIQHLVDVLKKALRPATAKKWGEPYDKTPLTSRIKEAVRPPGPLKPRLVLAIKRIELQIHKLDKAIDSFSERDKSIFARIVKAYQKHDMPRANVFANELAEIRKIEKMTMRARLALEQTVLRLRTVSELGDIVTTLAPAVGVLRSVKTGMSAIFPEAERELGQIGNLLNGIMIDAGQSTGLTINFDSANEDAQKILTEASTVAEQKIKEKFPELPASVSEVGERASTNTL